MVTSAIIDVRAEVNEGRREKQIVDAASSVRVHRVPCISKLRFMSIVPGRLPKRTLSSFGTGSVRYRTNSLFTGDVSAFLMSLSSTTTCANIYHG